MAQQTAVDWLEQQLKSMYDIDISRLSVTDKAKQMDKEQHKETFKQSRQAKIFEEGMPPVWEKFEQYYNETYGKE